ncbi:MAG: hypothetical protein HY873_12895, partial [Chloroflexi bacterium]|nr:hypothetical protein [Chloroflexota bacterium]
MANVIRALTPLCAAVVLLAVACRGGNGDNPPPTSVSTIAQTPAAAPGCSPARAAQPGDTAA